MGRNAATWAGLGLVSLAAVLFLAAGSLVPHEQSSARLAAGLGLIAITGLGLGFGWHEQASLALRQLLLWSAAVVIAAIAIGYRSEFLGAVNMAIATPGEPALRHSADADLEPGVVSLRAEQNGHFFAEALVNGTHVSFLVDTGATDLALAPADAERIGIDLASLNYRIPVNTANGQTFAAVVELDSVKIGSIHLERVSATIPQSALSHSLLGMSFLKRLSSFSIDSDRLVMRQ